MIKDNLNNRNGFCDWFLVGSGSTVWIAQFQKSEVDDAGELAEMIDSFIVNVGVIHGVMLWQMILLSPDHLSLLRLLQLKVERDKRSVLKELVECVRHDSCACLYLEHNYEQNFAAW